MAVSCSANHDFPSGGEEQAFTPDEWIREEPRGVAAKTTIFLVSAFEMACLAGLLAAADLARRVSIANGGGDVGVVFRLFPCFLFGCDVEVIRRMSNLRFVPPTVPFPERTAIYHL